MTCFHELIHVRVGEGWIVGRIGVGESHEFVFSFVFLANGHLQGVAYGDESEER